MPVADSMITVGRVRLLQVVAITFILSGVGGIIVALLGSRVSIISIAELPAGVGLLMLHRFGYIAAAWLAVVKVVVYSFSLLMAVSLTVAFRVIDSRMLIPVSLEDAFPAYAVLVGLIALAVWQAWVLTRPYVPQVFGETTKKEERA